MTQTFENSLPFGPSIWTFIAKGSYAATYSSPDNLRSCASKFSLVFSQWAKRWSLKACWKTELLLDCLSKKGD